MPLLARTREAGMACVVATQGIADLARVDPNLPQQITQNTAVRLALRQGSAEDQEGWSVLLGGAPIPSSDSTFVYRDRTRAVSPDDLAMLRTGEAFLQVMPGATDGTRKRLWVARPRRVGATAIGLHAPEPDQPTRTDPAWLWPIHTERRIGDAETLEPSPPSAVADHAARPGDPGEVLRWQQLTTRQIARWFFDSPRTATNRIAVLLVLGYLRTIDLPWRAPVLVTATPKAARARADLALKARASQPGRLLHDLTVVEVAAWLLEQDLQASWITERELLRDQLEQARDPAGRLRQGPTRAPRRRAGSIERPGGSGRGRADPEARPD